MRAVGLFDGKIIEVDEPVIRIEDRGYQFGDGVYDAWVAINGKHFLRKEHLDRLERSCNLIGIKPCYTRREVEEFTDKMLQESGIDFGIIYLQWTRGWQSPRSHIIGKDVKPLISGMAFPLNPYPEEFFTKGVKTIFYPDERHLMCHIKTLNLLGSVRGKNAAAEADAYEVLFVREMNNGSFVTECSLSNCFAVKNGVIYTAPNGKYILPGITRGVIIDLAKNLGYKLVEEFQTPDFFRNADEIFITNATAVMPNTVLDGKPVGDGKVGPVTKALIAEYQKLIDKVCY
ncbi:MAG: aminotransferase class IV [Bacillota bacterium]|uniref:Amino acid aminotransferase n=1 Tax=Thermanaerosceptrum fracticalcis TaxID=1712410 RepID=A0A7G6E386_THEFR|nr:aminotransferase class IV [Thermanaerosceptrum fracticalcis]QNB46540.1 amino acid aminotransferase [Thermanaerosceptrum fracticalcis]